jgi:hypothetical protein
MKSNEQLSGMEWVFINSQLSAILIDALTQEGTEATLKLYPRTDLTRLRVD